MKQLITRTLLLIVLSVTTGVQARAMLTDKLTFSSYKEGGGHYYVLTVDGFGEQWSTWFENESNYIDEGFGLSEITINIKGSLDFSKLSFFYANLGAVITISGNDNILFYGATVKGGKDDIITSCTSEGCNTITITLPTCSFKYIYLDYVTNEPITAQNTTISGVDDEYVYLGKDPEPVPTVKFKGNTLTEGTDYTVTHNYGGSLDNGDRWGSVTIEGTGEYIGSVTKNYAIRKVALTDFTQLGTNIYGIATPQQLYGLSAYVSAGHTCQGLTFRQTADITCDNTFTPIGSVSNRFKGTYDGQNYVISGINFSRTGNTQSDYYTGLFGYIDAGTVRDVILANSSFTGYYYVGGIVGLNLDGVITNCHVLSDVTIHAIQNNARTHGGIVGQNTGTVSSCTSAASITKASGASLCGVYGGILGSNYGGKVSDCIYLGSAIDGSDEIGAIAGVSNNGIFKKNYYTYAGFTGKDQNGHTVTTPAIGYTLNDIVDELTGLAPHDTQDNSGFVTLLAARTAALTAVERATPLSTAVDITLTGRTLYKDGYWNTLCLPFDVELAASPLEGDNVQAMTLDIATSGLSGSTLTLNFNTATSIPAGTPFIIKWDGGGSSNLVSPVFSGVTVDNSASTEVSFTGGTFKGTYAPIVWDAEDKSILFLGAANHLYWPQPDGSQNPSLGAFRAYFDLGTTGASEFVLNFEGETVTSIDNGQWIMDNEAGAWYDMQGRKLNGQPTQKGLYIHGGRKVVVK